MRASCLAAFAAYSLTVALQGVAGAPLGVAPRDLIDVAHSSAQLDLQGQSPVLHILRVDDLLDTDNKENPLLAERISHVLIRIQLDAQQSALRIGDQLVPIISQESPVAVIKTDALMVSKELASSISNEEQLQALAAKMSPGIVSLEVRVESQVIGGNAQGLRLRQVGIFVKIDEVEGVNFAHSSLIAVPLVQLVLEESDDSRIIGVHTLDGKPTVESLLQPGPVMMHHAEPFEAAAKHLPHNFHPVPSAEEMPEPSRFEHLKPHRILEWFANLLGLETAAHAPPPPPAHHRRPCPQQMKQGLAAAGATTEEPLFSMERLPGGDFVREMGDESSEVTEEASDRHHGHRHGHHRHHGHRRGGCFFRRTMRKIRRFFRAVASTQTGQMVLVWLASFSTVTFVIHVKRAIQRRRERRQRIVLTNDDEDVEKKTAEHMVYVDELPRYEETILVVEVPEKARLV